MSAFGVPMSRLQLVPGQVRPAVRITARRQAVAAGHPSVAPYDRVKVEPEADPTERTLALFVSPMEASLLERAVRLAYEREPAQAWVDLAGLVRDQRYRGCAWVDSDPTPGHGIGRPS